jgi:hypothetical protein
VDELPAAIDAGLAATLTVGAAGSVGGVLDLVPPHPVKIRRKAGNSNASGEAILKADG